MTCLYYSLKHFVSASSFFFPFFSFYRWLRSAELTCDRAALVVAQDHKVVISTLMKLAGGSPSLSQKLNVDAFIKQAKSYDEATSSPLGWYLRNAQVSQLTHPLPVMRAREIEQWSRSQEYKTLLKRGRKKTYGTPETPEDTEKRPVG